MQMRSKDLVIGLSEKQLYTHMSIIYSTHFVQNKYCALKRYLGSIFYYFITVPGQLSACNFTSFIHKKMLGLFLKIKRH